MLLDNRAPGLVIVAGEVGLAGNIPSRVAVRRPPAAVLAGSSPAAVLADSLHKLAEAVGVRHTVVHRCSRCWPT